MHSQVYVQDSSELWSHNSEFSTQATPNSELWTQNSQLRTQISIALCTLMHKQQTICTLRQLVWMAFQSITPNHNIYTHTHAGIHGCPSHHSCITGNMCCTHADIHGCPSHLICKTATAAHTCSKYAITQQDLPHTKTDTHGNSSHHNSQQQHLHTQADTHGNSSHHNSQRQHLHTQADTHGM